MTTTVDVPLVISPPAAATCPSGYGLVRFNALKHGILSRYAVLSHENADEYQGLVDALMDEHLPCGVTEQHLVEELASVIWRKRRVLQAEGSLINQGLKVSALNANTVIPAAAPFELGMSGAGSDLRDMMGMTPESVAELKETALSDIETLSTASAILRRGGKRAFSKALKSLTPELDGWWCDAIREGTYSSDPEGLATFLDDCANPAYMQEKQARHHEAIMAQAQGEGFQAWKLLPLSRYETQLDRKFERTLGMLLKLKDLRASR